MHNPESVQENETHQLRQDFEIQTDHQISTRLLDLVIVNKKKKKENYPNCEICCASWTQSEIKRKRNISTRTVLGNEKTVEHESDGDSNYNRCSHEQIGKGTGRIRNKNTSGYHLNYNILKICQNTEKSPGELRRIAVTYTPVEYHQLMLV